MPSGGQSVVEQGEVEAVRGDRTMGRGCDKRLTVKKLGVIV